MWQRFLWTWALFVLVVVVSVYTVCSSSSSSSSSSSAICEVTGTCVACRPTEMDNYYCRETGRRIRVRCQEGPNEYDDYKSCSKTAEDDQIEVIVFQVVIGLIGGLAYYGVQSRKKFTMSLFDVRKQRRQRLNS